MKELDESVKKWPKILQEAYKAGFCSIDPDGEPHLERPDYEDLLRFAAAVVKVAAEATKCLDDDEEILVCPYHALYNHAEQIHPTTEAYWIPGYENT